MWRDDTRRMALFTDNGRNPTGATPATAIAELQLRIDQATVAARSAREAYGVAGSPRAAELAGIADLLEQLSVLVGEGTADSGGPEPWRAW
jgi:hypothetical protein